MIISDSLAPIEFNNVNRFQTVEPPPPPPSQYYIYIYMYNCSTSIRVCSILIITSNTPEAFKYGNIKKYAYLSHIHIHNILTSKSKYSGRRLYQN